MRNPKDVFSIEIRWNGNRWQYSAEYLDGPDVCGELDNDPRHTIDEIRDRIGRAKVALGICATGLQSVCMDGSITWTPGHYECPHCGSDCGGECDTTNWDRANY